MDEKPTEPWRKRIALGVVAAVVVLVLAFHGRLAADLWPLDASRVGPNLIASVVQWAIIFVLAVLLWPPTRRRIHRFIDAKAEGIKRHVDARHAELHDRIDALQAHHEAHHDSLVRLHQKLDRLAGRDDPKP